jgi:hypothetical protein
LRTFAAFAALSLLIQVGCEGPAGIVLLFPSTQEMMEAKQANFIALKTSAACGPFTQFPPVEPTMSDVQKELQVGLTNGKPTSSLKGLPTGNRTLLVKVQN